MVSLVLHIENNEGKRAFVGDEIKLDLLVQGWINSEGTYRITEIRPDGTIVLDNGICQHISGIKNFRLVNRRRV